jgi:hypothetical protein
MSSELMQIRGWYKASGLKNINVIKFHSENERYSFILEANKELFINTNSKLHRLLNDINWRKSTIPINSITVYVPDLFVASQEPRFCLPGQQFKDPIEKILEPYAAYEHIDNYGIF